MGAGPYSGEIYTFGVYFFLLSIYLYIFLYLPAALRAAQAAGI